MKKLFLLMIMAACTCTVRAQFVSLNNNEVTKLKQLITDDTQVRLQYNDLKRDADKALNDRPDPIDTLHTEGRLQGDPQKAATWNAVRDMHKMYALAVVYRVSGEKRYLNKAVEFLTAWANINKANGDPIDDTNLDQAVETYDLLKNDIDPQSNKLITAWLASTAQREIDRWKPSKATGYNNWHSHRLKEVGEIGFAIGDKKFENWAVDGIKAQIGRNLLPDGSSIDFKLRDALHYHVYDLEPLLKLSIILKRVTGVDYYNYVSPQGTSIRKSVEWLLPFLNGEKTHGEFTNSTVAFDKKRADNGEKGYKAGTLFEPRNGLGTLYLAEYFYPDAINLIQKLNGSTSGYLNWQLLLNKIKRE
mgnify:CR=1 FL=1